MDFTQHYLSKAKEISFFGEMKGAVGDIILVPHKVTTTAVGNSTRLVPSPEFPSVRLSKFLNNTQFAYLKPNILCNGQATLPSRINEMLYYLKPFDANVVRQELKSLHYSDASIEGFLEMFPSLQQQNLTDSKVAQAGKIILDWKSTKKMYEERVIEKIEQHRPKFCIHCYLTAAEAFEREKQRMMNDKSVDMFFSDKVHEYSSGTSSATSSGSSSGTSSGISLVSSSASVTVSSDFSSMSSLPLWNTVFPSSVGGNNDLNNNTLDLLLN